MAQVKCFVPDDGNDVAFLGALGHFKKLYEAMTTRFLETCLPRLEIHMFFFFFARHAVDIHLRNQVGSR